MKENLPEEFSPRNKKEFRPLLNKIKRKLKGRLGY